MLKLNRKPDEGFTLVELLIVVAIIGIIAAIAIPNLLSAIQRGKQKRTMGDIKTTGTGLESYNTDNNAYPAVAIGMAAVGVAAAPYGAAGCTQCLNPDYIVSPIWKDGWYSTVTPRTFFYGTSTATVQDYALSSCGKDGAAQGAHSCATGNTAASIAAASVDGTTFDCDVTLQNGQFTQAPLGKQTNTAGVC
jgi:general secretion pathway protein G